MSQEGLEGCIAEQEINSVTDKKTIHGLNNRYGFCFWFPTIIESEQKQQNETEHTFNGCRRPWFAVELLW
jgi:hypothetical protein